MLHLLRNPKIKKKIYIVLAIAVIASFVISGLLVSQEEGKSGSALAELNGKKIHIQDYLASYRAMEHQAIMMYGDNFPRLRPLLNLKGQAWDRLLLLDYAKKQGVHASDEEVVGWIAKQSFFFYQGRFDDRAYKVFIKEYLKTDARQFEEEIRQMLIIGKVQDKIDASVTLDAKELERLYIQEKGARDIQYAILPWETEKGNVFVTDEELKQLYPLFQNRLREPAKVSISYILVTSDTPETSKKAAEDTQSDLNQLASQYNLPVQKTGLFSQTENIPGLGLLPEVLKQAFTLEKDAESGWIKSGGNFYKIKVLEKNEGGPLDFEIGKEPLREVVLKDKAAQLASNKLENLRKTTRPEDFESSLKRAGLDVQSFKDFKSGVYLPGIGPSENIEQMLSQLKEGEVSEPITVRNGAAIFKIVKNASMDRAAFEKDKEEFKKKAVMAKAEEEIEELLVKLRANLKLDTEAIKQIFPSEEEK